MTQDHTPDQSPEREPRRDRRRGRRGSGPFDAFGGGFDMSALLQQAQQMQEQLEDAQEQLAEATVEGTVGGGAVTVTVNGVGELVGVAHQGGRLRRRQTPTTWPTSAT